MPVDFSGGGGSSGGGTWGSITGTLSSQTDLQTALDLKAPLASPTFTGTVTAPDAGTWTSTGIQLANAKKILFGTSSNWINVDTAFDTNHIKINAASAASMYRAGSAMLIADSNNVSFYKDIIPEWADQRKIGYQNGFGPIPWSHIWVSSLNVVPVTVALTADNQAVVTAQRSIIFLTSNDTTAANRTFTLNAPSNSGTGPKQDGQFLILKMQTSNASGACELANSGNVVLNNALGAWTPNIGDTLMLVADSANAKWYEINRSDNSA